MLPLGFVEELADPVVFCRTYSPNTERRIEPFMDCLAFLLAKRWLREQQQSEEKLSQDQREPQGDQLDK